MTNKQIKQTMFALCAAALFTTGCSNELPTSGVDNGNGEEDTSVIFSLGMPQGDEVNYTRADVADDESEWTISSLRVYHFCATVQEVQNTPADGDYKLVKSYDVPVKKDVDLTAGICLNNGDGKYGLKLALRTNKIGELNKHAFAFVANDVCSEFDDALEAEVTTLEALKKQVADKQVTNGTASPALFMGDPAGLCMTGVIENQVLKSGLNTISNAGTPTPMTRIMARLDIKNFVPQERNLQLKSVRLIYSGYFTAPKGYLFKADNQDYIWSTAEETMEITQNEQFDKYGYLPVESYSEDSGMKDLWAAATTTTIKNGSASIVRNGVWYKKVLYMYEFPTRPGNGAGYTTPVEVEVAYTLNGSPSTATVKILDSNNVNIPIERNTVYTLQVGETTAEGGELTFTFAATPWTVHDIDMDLSDPDGN